MAVISLINEIIQWSAIYTTLDTAPGTTPSNSLHLTLIFMQAARLGFECPKIIL